MSFQKDQKYVRRALGITAVGLIGLGVIANRIDNTNRALIGDSVGTNPGIEQIVDAGIPIEERIIDPTIERTEDKSAENTERNLVRPSQNNRDMNYDLLYQDLKKHEGVREIAYDDIGGKSIGAGFNLERPDAKEKIESLGLDYSSVYNGKAALNESQIELLLRDCVETAVSDAKKYIGENYWNGLDGKAKEILGNMSYNLGIQGLSGFVNLREALRNEDYARAADEMVDSKWYKQTGDRAEELAERMRSIK